MHGFSEFEWFADSPIVDDKRVQIDIVGPAECTVIYISLLKELLLCKRSKVAC